MTKLEPFTQHPTFGDLVATINHIGRVAGGGHYVAYIKREDWILQDGLHQQKESPFNPASSNSTIQIVVFVSKEQ